MSGAKTYLGTELNQKVPQKIIAHLKIACIDHDERIIAVFGSTSLLGFDTSIVSTEDRLICLENLGLTYRTSAYLYFDISQILIDNDKNGKCLSLILISNNRVKLNIEASLDEFNKFCLAVNGYKETGISYIRNKLAADCYYRIKVNAIHNHEDYKIAVNNAKIHDKFQEKENKLSLEKNLGCYKLNYIKGLSQSGMALAAVIIINALNQLMEIYIDDVLQMTIPFTNITGSTITTDADVPANDGTNQYLYYLHIYYNQGGINSEVIFCKKQKQYSTIDHIQELNYVLQHIHEKISPK